MRHLYGETRFALCGHERDGDEDGPRCGRCHVANEVLKLLPNRPGYRGTDTEWKSA